MLELQNFEENIFNPLINQIFKFSSADLILEKDEKEAGEQGGEKEAGEQGGDFVQHWHRVALPCGRWGRAIQQIVRREHTQPVRSSAR